METMSKEERLEKVIEVLNKARSMELFVISQYMNQHYGLDDQEYGTLARAMKLIAIDEMRHAEQFAERIKELGGEPTTELSKKVQRGQDIRAIYPFDSREEDDTIDAYSQFIAVCKEAGDEESAKLLRDIIAEEEVHMKHFESVGEQIVAKGDAFLASIEGTSASTGPACKKGFVADQQK